MVSLSPVMSRAFYSELRKLGYDAQAQTPISTIKYNPLTQGFMFGGTQTVAAPQVQLSDATVETYSPDSPTPQPTVPISARAPASAPADPHSGNKPSMLGRVLSGAALGAGMGIGSMGAHALGLDPASNPMAYYGIHGIAHGMHHTSGLDRNLQRIGDTLTTDFKERVQPHLRGGALGARAGWRLQKNPLLKIPTALYGFARGLSKTAALKKLRRRMAVKKYAYVIKMAAHNNLKEAIDALRHKRKNPLTFMIMGERIYKDQLKKILQQNPKMPYNIAGEYANQATRDRLAAIANRLKRS